MNKTDLVEQAISALTEAKSSTSCDDMERLLVGLGFTVRNGKKIGHRIYVHDGIDGFTSASYSCGHKKNQNLDRCYVLNVIRVLNQHKVELTKFIGEVNDG